MTFHQHRTPLPAAVPPAAKGLPGPMRRAELREAIADRVERLLVIMDALDGDPDLEADLSGYRRQPDGTWATVGLSCDDEPSLCGVGTHDGGSGHLWQGYPQTGGNCGDSAEDLEQDEADDEPSLAAPEPIVVGFLQRGPGGRFYFAEDQTHWAQGGRDDREHDAGDDREEENEHGTDLDAGEGGDDNGIADWEGATEQGFSGYGDVR